MRVVIIHEGTFGAAVAARLAKRFPGAVQATLDEADEAVYERADVVLVASWHRRQRTLDQIDALCHRAGIRWSAAVLEGMHLVVGPLVVPGSGACMACYWRRHLTHARTPQWELALADAYEANPARGPAGFPPAAVGMAAAALAADAVAQVRLAGRVVRASLLGGELVETRVVPVHGCERCGIRRARPDRRFVDQLVPQLEEMFAP